MAKRIFKKRKIIRKRKSTKKKSSLVKLIRRTVQKVAEKKQISNFDIGTNIVPASSASAAGQIFPLCFTTGGWEVSQGTAQNQRVGNRIRLTKATFSGIIIPKPYNATTFPNPQPQVIQMYIYWDKQNPTSVPDPFAANDFFNLGSTAMDFTNSLVDSWLPINTDRYNVVVRKTFKIGYSAYEGTGINVGSQAFSNNDFKLAQRFTVNLTKHLPKNVVYNDNTVEASSRGLYVMFVTCASDGGLFGSGLVPAEVAWTANASFTDL